MSEQVPIQRPTRHICIATGQNLANLIPCLQLGATEVIILETPVMREAAGNLKRVLERRGIVVQRIPFDDQSPAAITSSAEEVALELGEKPLVFNATGGHKLMTLALAEKMEIADNLHLLYTETRHDRLHWLKPWPVMEQMDNVLKLDDILNVQGYREITDRDERVHWQMTAQNRAELTRKMGDDAPRYAKFFGLLNRLADQALNEDGKPFRPEQELDFTPGGHGVELLEHAAKLKLLYWDRDTKIVFSSAEAAQYFRGGWLEEFVWFKLQGIKPDDYMVRTKACSFAQDVENEFDALVVHRNRLLVIECKTVGFGHNDIKDVSYIYKLAQLADKVGGNMSSKLLLSARPVHEEIRQRAKEYHVDILASGEVKGFVNYLRRWMMD